SAAGSGRRAEAAEAGVVAGEPGRGSPGVAAPAPVSVTHTLAPGREPPGQAGRAAKARSAAATPSASPAYWCWAQIVPAHRTSAGNAPTSSATVLIPGCGAYGLEASPRTTSWSPGAASTAARSAWTSGAYSPAPSDGAPVAQLA